MVRFTNFKSSPQPKESHKYEMSGVLCKMGEVNKSWKERFFILEDDKLFYYKNNEATKAIAYIPLNDAYVRVSPEFYPKLACFEIVTAQRIYKLQAANFELMKTWIHHCQTFSKISMENELIRQADIQICATEAAFSKKLLEELHFEPMPLDNFYFVCKYEDDDSDLLEGVTTTPLEVENSKESNITNATRTRHRSAAMNLSFSSQLSHLINSESSSSLNASSSVIISNDEQEFVEDMLPSTPQNKANVSINSTSPSSDYSVPPTSSLMQSSSLLLSSSLIEGQNQELIQRIDWQ